MAGVDTEIVLYTTVAALLSLLLFTAWYLRRLRSDVHSTEKRLRALLSLERRSRGTASHREERPSASEGQLLFQTKEGLKIASLFDRLQIQHTTLRTHLETETKMRGIQEEVQSSGTSLDEIFEKTAHATPEALFDKTLQFLEGKFNLHSLAMLSLDDSESDDVRVQTRGASSTRLVELLSNLYEPTLRFQSNIGLGIGDAFSGEVTANSFVPFGIRSTYAFKVETNKCGVLIVWMAFSGQDLPSSSTLQILEEIVQRLRRELQETLTALKFSSHFQEEKESSQQKSDFLAHMSHDIRSPLNNIKSVLHLVEVEDEKEVRKEMLDAARHNCESLTEIVEDVLDFSRYNVGKLEARPEECRLSEIAEQVVQSYRISAQLKNLAIHFHSGDLDGVCIDRRQIRRVLGNIIGNAIKYTGSGSITVEISENQGTVSCAIRDTGYGMDAEELQKLFDPFTRFHPDKAAGAGLGLALTKILVELNGGQIQVESAPQKGSIFTIRFPLQAGFSQSSQMKEEASSPAPSKSEISFLLVDDDTDCNETLSRTLIRFGHKTFCASSVQEAHELLKKSPVDIVISDGSMHDGGAEQMITVALQFGVPVIVVSGRDDKDFIDRCILRGAKSFLLKPLDIEELLKEVRRAVS